jgi:prepilin-type N-terminal cleavage/methylation domain-containing protein
MNAKLRNNRGISMLEMMIAVVIAGLLAAISVPNLSGAIKKMKFDNEGRDLVSTMRYARSASINLQKPVGIYLDSDHKKVVAFLDLVSVGLNTYDVGDSVLRSDSVEANVTYMGSTFSGQTVVFQPDGTASSGGYVMLHGSTGQMSRSLSISVTAGSGRVRLDYYI